MTCVESQRHRKKEKLVLVLVSSGIRAVVVLLSQDIHVKENQKTRWVFEKWG